MKKKVLFVCMSNRARSQMAGAFLNSGCPEYCTAQSPGLKRGKLKPVLVQATSGLDPMIAL